jgi:hypothetical protein
MKAHQDAVVRLAALPGLGIDSAQQIIPEVGPQAAAFPSAAQLASWVGVCPGRHLGYAKAVWAIAHRPCRLIWTVLHDGVSYVGYGPAPTPLASKRKRQRLVTQLKKLGYQVQLIPALSDASNA